MCATFRSSISPRCDDSIGAVKWATGSPPPKTGGLRGGSETAGLSTYQIKQLLWPEDTPANRSSRSASSWFTLGQTWAISGLLSGCLRTMVGQSVVGIKGGDGRAALWPLLRPQSRTQPRKPHRDWAARSLSQPGAPCPPAPSRPPTVLSRTLQLREGSAKVTRVTW